MTLSPVRDQFGAETVSYIHFHRDRMHFSLTVTAATKGVLLGEPRPVCRTGVHHPLCPVGTINVIRLDDAGKWLAVIRSHTDNMECAVSSTLMTL